MYARVIIVLAALAIPARADDLTAAQQHLDAGVARYEAGDFAAARDELLAAQAAAPDKPNPYRWLALAEARLGDCAAAIVHAEGFLARVAVDDPRIGELQRLRDQCRSTGHVHVVSRPTGATIRVDDRATSITPADLALSVGSHVLAVDRPGYEPVTQTIEVRAAGVTEAMFTLHPTPAPPNDHRLGLWTMIGFVVVAVTVGTVYELTRGRDDPHLPPIACDGTGCR